MRKFLRSTSACALLSAVLMNGCGGSGGGGASALPIAPGTPVDSGSAKFNVNVLTGEVTVDSLSHSRSTVFSGGAISFASSTLVNEGTLGRRRLSVSLKNNGQDAMIAPFAVHFRNFTNVTAPATDLRALHNISTIAGSGTVGTTDGPAGSANLSNPTAVTSDGNGNIYIASTDGTVRRLQNGIISTIASGLGTLRGIVFTKTFQSTEALFVTDSSAMRIHRVSLNNFTVSVFAGSGASGTTDSSSLLTAQFNQPHGIAVDSESPTALSLLVTDSGSTTLRRVSSQGGVSTVAFDLLGPRGIAKEGSVIAVANRNANSIRIISGGVSSNLGGTSGFEDGVGSSVKFASPSAVALKNGVIYVADQDNHRIRQGQLRPGAIPTSAANWQFATVAGSGVAGFVDGDGSSVRLNSPAGLFFTDNNLLLVADQANHRIRRIISTGPNFPVDIPNGATSTSERPRLANPTSYIPDGVERTPVIEVASPSSLAPGASTNLGNWDFIVPAGITAFSFVVEVEATTSLLAPPDSVSNAGPTNPGGSPNVRVRGFAGSGPGFADGSLVSAAFNDVSQMARSTDGTIFIADTGNHLVRRIATNGTVSTIAGSPKTSGTTDGTGDVARLTSPTGVACEPDGKTLYVSQANHAIRRVELRDDFDENPGTGSVPGDPAQRASYTVSTMAGLAGTAGFADGSNGVDARLNEPGHLVLAGNAQLFFVEAAGQRVRSLSLVGANPRLPSSWRVLTVAGDNTVATPATGNSDGTGSQVRFAFPRSIVLAQDGFLYVADAGNNRIRRVSTAGQVTTVAGSIGGYGDAGNPLSAKFSTPTALGADSSNVLYVGEVGNSMLRKFGNGVASVAGTQASGTADGTGKTAQFQLISSLLVLPNGDILVGDGSRIRLIQRIISTAKP